jgi:hypothetical protein
MIKLLPQVSPDTITPAIVLPPPDFPKRGASSAENNKAKAQLKMKEKPQPRAVPVQHPAKRKPSKFFFEVSYGLLLEAESMFFPHSRMDESFICYNVVFLNT